MKTKWMVLGLALLGAQAASADFFDRTCTSYDKGTQGFYWRYTLHMDPDTTPQGALVWSDVFVIEMLKVDEKNEFHQGGPEPVSEYDADSMSFPHRCFFKEGDKAKGQCVYAKSWDVSRKDKKEILPGKKTVSFLVTCVEMWDYTSGTKR